MEDRQIIALLKSSPQDGLREAITKYRGMVALIVSRILPGSPEDAEECIADVFVNVWKKIGALDETGGNLKGLLICAARSRAIDRIRSLKRTNVVLLEELELSSGEDVVDELTSEEDLRTLQGLISEMPPPDREIFIRKCFLFERVDAIAERLGLDTIQVKNRLYRGRQRLKKALAERGVAL